MDDYESAHRQMIAETRKADSRLKRRLDQLRPTGEAADLHQIVLDATTSYIGATRRMEDAVLGRVPEAFEAAEADIASAVRRSDFLRDLRALSRLAEQGLVQDGSSPRRRELKRLALAPCEEWGQSDQAELSRKIREGDIVTFQWLITGLTSARGACRGREPADVSVGPPAV